MNNFETIIIDLKCGNEHPSFAAKYAAYLIRASSRPYKLIIRALHSDLTDCTWENFEAMFAGMGVEARIECDDTTGLITWTWSDGTDTLGYPLF